MVSSSRLARAAKQFRTRELDATMTASHGYSLLSGLSRISKNVGDHLSVGSPLKALRRIVAHA
jgi:hypothetical protein